MEAPLKTKNAYRTLPLARDTIDVLNQQKKKVGSSLWVFSGPTGGPMSQDSVLHMLHWVLKRAGLPKVRFHEMLHTYEQKSQSRDELVREARRAIRRLTREMSQSIFYTELTTGLRRGELCGLTWDDFDSEAGTLKVRRTIHARKGGGLEAGETKTYAGQRTILLPYSTTQLLKERRTAALTKWIFPDPLRPERPVNPSSAYRRLKELLKQAGLPSLRFHDLRHTFATHALASGVDAKTLSGILGHTKASFTLDTYTHVTGDMHRNAAEIVGNVITEWLGDDLTVWQNEGSGATAAST